MKQISLNFGAIKDTIYRHSNREFLNESNQEKTTILNKFLLAIKENPALKIQYLIFKNLEEGYFKKERLAERYINQNLKLLENVSWEKIMDVNRNVRIELLGDAHVEGKNESEELYENVHSLIESVTKKGYNDVDKAQCAYESVLEYLLKERTEVKKEETEKNDNPKLFSWNFIHNLAVSNFNQRYSHLNESERNILKILLSTEEKKKLYLEDLKIENHKLIDELLNGNKVESAEIKTILDGFKSKLNKIDLTSSENIDEAIINYSELKELLMEK